MFQNKSLRIILWLLVDLLNREEYPKQYEISFIKVLSKEGLLSDHILVTHLSAASPLSSSVF